MQPLVNIERKSITLSSFPMGMILVALLCQSVSASSGIGESVFASRFEPPTLLIYRFDSNWPIEIAIDNRETDTLAALVRDEERDSESRLVLYHQQEGEMSRLKINDDGLVSAIIEPSRTIYLEDYDLSNETVLISVFDADEAELLEPTEVPIDAELISALAQAYSAFSNNHGGMGLHRHGYLSNAIANDIDTYRYTSLLISGGTRRTDSN